MIAPGPGAGADAGVRPKNFHGDNRDAWERVLAVTRKSFEGTDPIVVAEAILEDFRHFEAAMHFEERRLVADPLLWTDQDLATGRWIEGAYYTFSRCAARSLGRQMPGDALRISEEDRLRYASLAAVSLAAGGSSIKWAQIADAGRRPALLKDLQAVLLQSEAMGTAEMAVELPVHARKIVSPAAPILVRALILDALCHGNLRRQPLGAIDCWLWEWLPEYPLLSGDLAGAQLRTGVPDKGGAGGTRVVSLEAMPGHIEQVVKHFRGGQIYPGHGVSVELRVEDHVLAIDALRGFLVASRQKGGSRQQREIRVQTVEVLVGLPEVFKRAFRVNESMHGGDVTAAGGADEERETAATGSPYGPNLRMVDIVDASPGGIGFEYDDSASPLEGGTLLAVRLDGSEPAVLCEVVRRLASPGRRSRIGTRVLAGEKRRIHLYSTKWPDGIEAIYIAGEDASGRADSLLLSGTACDPSVVHVVELPDRTFRLRLSRVRRRGHGWALASIELLDQ